MPSIVGLLSSLLRYSFIDTVILHTTPHLSMGLQSSLFPRNGHAAWISRIDLFSPLYCRLISFVNALLKRFLILPSGLSSFGPSNAKSDFRRRRRARRLRTRRTITSIIRTLEDYYAKERSGTQRSTDVGHRIRGLVVDGKKCSMVRR